MGHESERCVLGEANRTTLVKELLQQMNASHAHVTDMKAKIRKETEKMRAAECLAKRLRRERHGWKMKCHHMDGLVTQVRVDMHVSIATRSMGHDDVI